MNITTIRPSALSAEQAAAWKELLGAQPGFDSPFFHPAYVQLLGEHRPQVEVALITDGDRLTGVLPFERHRAHVGRPLGVKMADFQGPLLSSGCTVSAADLLAGCGLSVLHFDHLLAGESSWAPWCREEADSPYLDLSAGFDAYTEDRKQAGTNQIAQTGRKRRKLEREVGPIRFEWRTDREDVFDALLRWKSAQRQKSGTFDVLQIPWVVQFLSRLRTADKGDFRGVMSALYVNDQLIAAHLGMRAGQVLHHWFPAYDAEFYRYSPGLILLLETARVAAERGIVRIDLGKGDDQYKESFRSDGFRVATGAVDRRPLRHSLRCAWFRARSWIKASPYREHVRSPKRILRRIQNQWNMG